MNGVSGLTAAIRLARFDERLVALAPPAVRGETILMQRHGLVDATWHPHYRCMTTGTERRALVFAAAMAALGMVARVVRARDTRPDPTPQAVRALDAQIARVDSARRSASRGTRSSSRGAGAAPNGGRGAVSTSAVREPIQVDLDVADAAAIERLPWIGPALAARIVENRGRCGPFGSIEALTRVNGIGVATAKRLAPHVTFSGRSSPTGASPTQGCQGGARGAAPSRRGRS